VRPAHSRTQKAFHRSCTEFSSAACRLTPTHPPRTRDMPPPFPRAHSHTFDTSHGKSWMAESPAHKNRLSNEEVLRTFFGALGPSADQGAGPSFKAAFAQLVHPEFLIRSGTTAKTRAEWEPYWELMAMSGATASDLQLLVQDDQEVVYTVQLLVGSTRIHLSHIAQFRDGKLYRIVEPEAPTLSTATAGAVPAVPRAALLRSMGARPVARRPSFAAAAGDWVGGAPKDTTPTAPADAVPTEDDDGTRA